MTAVDDAILEWLGEHEVAAPPKVVHANLETPVSYSQVKRRVRELDEKGLIYRDGSRNDYYAITEIGRWYLEGAVASEKLEALAEADRSPKSVFGPDLDGSRGVGQ